MPASRRSAGTIEAHWPHGIGNRKAEARAQRLEDAVIGDGNATAFGARPLTQAANRLERGWWLRFGYAGEEKGSAENATLNNWCRSGIDHDTVYKTVLYN